MKTIGILLGLWITGTLSESAVFRPETSFNSVNAKDAVIGYCQSYSQIPGMDQHSGGGYQPFLKEQYPNTFLLLPAEAPCR